MRFEYKIVATSDKVDYDKTAETSRAELAKWMNELGGDGWELIHYAGFGNGYIEGVYTVWKRAHAP